ncbi:MAG: UDP-N-acetylmuramate dehydrogenase [Pyrinomonadaceae bacterium]
MKDISENIPLAPYTTLKIGGPARFFLKAESEDDVIDGLAFADKHALPVFILGGGSNLLISDNGFPGLVIQIALKGITSKLETEGSRLVVAQAGGDWDEFVVHCVKNDLAGVECLSGIPGFVGGTPVQNVGAYGQDVSETIVSVRCLNRLNREIVELSNDDCGFAYRTSIFNSTHRDRFIVLAVSFALSFGGSPKLAYKDIIEHFGDHQPSLAEVRDAVLKIRRAKSMVIDPADPNSRSAGSFFKNPIVDRSTLDEIAAVCPAVPSFNFDQTRVKIPAAWLIENAGFHKGSALGNAGISSNHTLALINRGGATAAEFLRLKREIQVSVRTKFGIDLIPEPVFLGLESDLA